MTDFKSTYPFSAFGGKIDPISEIRNAGIVTSGNVYWVKHPDDADYISFKDQVGRENLFDTVQEAIDKTVSDQNDYVLVCPKADNSNWVLGTAVDLDKNRVHLISVGYGESMHGYSNTLEGYVAADGVDTELMKITGAGVEVAGFRLLGTSGTADGGTLSGGLLAFATASTGTPHGAWIHHVTVENTQAAADSGTADLVTFKGDVASGITGVKFSDCWIGNRSWIPTSCVGVTGTAGPSFTEFHNVTFLVDAQATSDSFITWGTGETKYTEFNNCRFINVEAGTKPVSAVEGALLVDNPVVSINSVGINVTAIGTDTEFLAVPIQAGTNAAGLHNPNIGIIGTAPIPAA